MSKSEGRATAIISLVVGLVGGSAAAAVITFFSTSTIEMEKFSYSLIQQALEAEDPKKRLDRLSFINDMGLFDGNPGLKLKIVNKIRQAETTPNILPQLPPPIPATATSQETRSLAIVIGSDSSHAAALDEVQRAADNGFPGAKLYLRQGRWRTVIPFDSAQAAEAALPTLSNISFGKLAFKIDLNIWCSSQKLSSDDKGSFIECKE